MSDTIREFLRGTILAEGGVVEDSAAGLEALLPGDAARRLGLPEELVFHLGPSDPPDDESVLDARIGSPALERLVADRLDRPAIAAVELPRGLPLPLPDDAPVLLNAVAAGAAERRDPTPVRYLDADVRVTLQGEDLRSTIVPVIIRLDDGARTERIRVGGAYPVDARPLDDAERANARAALRAWLQRDAPTLLAGSLETIRRRAARDLDRLADYYASLNTEMARAVDRVRTERERRRRHAKWAALPADLEGRREQVRVRSRPRLAGRLFAATIVQTDVERYVLPVRRRKQAGTVVLGCRLADGRFEGPACAACRRAALRLYLCDERLHVLCEGCGQAGRLDPIRCPACSRAQTEQPRLVLDDPTTRLRIGPVPENDRT